MSLSLLVPSTICAHKQITAQKEREREREREKEKNQSNL